MTDLPTPPTQPPAAIPADSSAPADSAAPQQSPLDVLDQILNDAQSKAAKEAEAQAAKEKAEAEAKIAAQKVIDQQNLQAELVKIQGMKQSPQYQAAAQQEQDAKQEQETKAKEMAGMEIRQLQHTEV